MTERRLMLLRAAGLAVAAALAVVAVWAAERAGSLGTSYAAASGPALTADVLAALALLGAGALAWHQQPGRRLAALTILGGAAWSAQDWIGWEGAPVVRTMGALLATLLVPVVLHVVGGRRAPRPLLVSVYAAAALTAIGLALFRDPFTDVSCWRNCTDDVVLVGDVPWVAAILAPAGAWIAAAGGAAVAALAWLRLRERRGLLPWAAAAAGLAECAYGLQRALGSEDPRGGLIFLLRAGAMIALALGVASVVLGARRSRLALARLGRELAADPPGGLRALLVRSLGDPTLEVGYWVPGRGYVDLDGRPVSPPAASTGRASTTVVRGEQPVALIVHHRRLLDELRLERHVGAAASLAADNERLRAELSAHLEDLRLARGRIVAAADDRRRRLERDLHDSAQQRLLAVGYDLRLARAAALAAGNDELAAVLADAGSDTAAVLDALRRLARGIFPAILDEAGLGPALETLAELTPLPLEIRGVPEARLPPPVELAMYLVVQTAVQAASAAGASYAAVVVARDGDALSSEVSTDATVELDVPVPLQDRLGALGGRALAVGTGIRAEAPCA